jgi:integral membrane sensor domain MASE1
LNPFPFEIRMQSPTYRWMVNGLLALAIIVTAELGRLVGIQDLPLAISVVWPPSGIALAGLLLFGIQAWPGILVGSFAYNFLHIYLANPGLAGPFTAALVVATGSLAQALLSAYIIQRFSSPRFFATVTDVLIFLIPAGLIANIVASSIGISALYFSGFLAASAVGNTWITFWLGDSLGVYVFTPLIVIWATQRPTVRLSEYGWEAGLMLIALMALGLLTFAKDYPLLHLFIPLTLWTTYRFRLHGATLAILAITLMDVIPTSLGYGPFSTYTVGDQLLIQVSFIEVIVIASLLLAAVVNERQRAWRLLMMHNVDLQDAVDTHRQELREMHTEIFVKEKMASLGLLTLRISRQLQGPLKKITGHSKICDQALKDLINVLSSEHDNLDPDVAVRFRTAVTTLENSFDNIAKAEALAHRIMECCANRLRAPCQVRSRSAP